MSLHISDRATASLVRIAVTARIVYGVIVDMPGLYNAGWLAVLLGGLLALPLSTAVALFRNKAVRSAKIFRLISAVGFAFIAWDASVVAAAIAGSASYMALNSVVTGYLMIPLFLLCLACLSLNGNAIGSSAGIWNRISLLLLILIIALEFGDLHPAWLMPVFGPGPESLLIGSIRIAGWLSIPNVVYLLCESGKDTSDHRYTPIKTLLLTMSLAAFVCALHSMMTPSITNSNLNVRSFRLDTLLANGRSGLGLQFPAIALWFTSLFYTLLFETFTCSLLLQRAVNALSKQSCIFMTLIFISLAAVSTVSGRNAGLLLAPLLFLSQGVFPVAALILTNLERKHRQCAKQP